jgi:hypothetical protein
MYVEGNPINFTDPSGYITEKESTRAELILEKLSVVYNVKIEKDWGWVWWHRYDYMPGNGVPFSYIHCEWKNGNWRNVEELQYTFDAVRIMSNKIGGINKFKTVFQNRPINIVRLIDGNGNAGLAPRPPISNNIFGDVLLYDGAFRSDYTNKRVMGYVVHELAHVWDSRYGYEVSTEYADFINPYTKFCPRGYCTKRWDPDNPNHIQYFPTEYSKANKLEYWAESFTTYVFPSLALLNKLTSLSKSFINTKINNIP